MTQLTEPNPVRPVLNAVLSLGLLGMLSPASAALLLDASSGAVHTSASMGVADKDDGAFAGAYVFLTPFFGGNLADPAPTVSLNGFIRFGEGDGSDGSFLQPLGLVGMTRIAPMWVDFRIGASGQVIEHADPGFNYYGVTWENMESVEFPGNHATFQAIFFEAATTLHGVDFNAGDIAFSYADVSLFPTITETVIGLEDGADFATIPLLDGTRGAASYINYGDFPVGENEYIHLRPDGAGNYISTIAPIPEPAAALLGAAGALALLRRRNRG